MQELPNALVERFKEYGGELRLSSHVKKILIKKDSVAGVVVGKDEAIPSRYVISNCDTRQSFLTLLGGKARNQIFLTKIRNMQPSLSGFILYLGIDGDVTSLPSPGVNLWCLSYYDLDRAYVAAKQGDLENIGGYVLHVSPDRRTVFAFMNGPFKNRAYWKKHKTEWLELFLLRIEKEVIPDLIRHIIFKDAATPQTLYKYTSNYRGAAFGWAALPSQLADLELRKPPFPKNLYMTGHWTTHGLGIPGVVYVARETASLIIKKDRHRDD